MEEKFFMHRIQKEDGAYTKGIEVKDTKDEAILSFWGRMKLGYNNPNKPNLTMVSCMITDINGNVIAPYNMTWKKEGETDNNFFMHHIRKDGDSFVKDIDICEDFDAARYSYASNMEYGYNNPSHPNVELVSCMITEMGGVIMNPYNETWKVAEPEPEPEPEE